MSRTTRPMGMIYTNSGSYRLKLELPHYTAAAHTVCSRQRSTRALCKLPPARCRPRWFRSSSTWENTSPTRAALSSCSCRQTRCPRVAPTRLVPQVAYTATSRARSSAPAWSSCPWTRWRTQGARRIWFCRETSSPKPRRGFCSAGSWNPPRKTTRGSRRASRRTSRAGASSRELWGGTRCGTDARVRRSPSSRRTTGSGYHRWRRKPRGCGGEAGSFAQNRRLLFPTKEPGKQTKATSPPRSFPTALLNRR
mmetsp:Transcript_5908/g.19618  ORF Transcript_5908/g.19618 Transcript_5908/m.19618 type:complete len:252 (-) Transcript_5908:4390-5145(-)